MENLEVKFHIENPGKWSNVTVDSANYVFKFERKDEQGVLKSISCWLSDFTSMWIETITADDVVERLKKCNPLLACNEMLARIISTITKMPLNENNVTVTGLNNNDVLHLSTKYYLSDGSDQIPLKFYWSLNVGSFQSFYENFSEIMLSKITDLEKTNDFLIETIRQKDEQLQKYAVMSSLVGVIDDDQEINGQRDATIHSELVNTEKSTEIPGVCHDGFTCNICGEDIYGHRYRCFECEDFDLCTTCEHNKELSHAQHIMVRYAQPEDKARSERIFRNFNKQSTKPKSAKKKRYSKN